MKKSMQYTNSNIYLNKANVTDISDMSNLALLIERYIEKESKIFCKTKSIKEKNKLYRILLCKYMDNNTLHLLGELIFHLMWLFCSFMFICQWLFVSFNSINILSLFITISGICLLFFIYEEFIPFDLISLKTIYPTLDIDAEFLNIILYKYSIRLLPVNKNLNMSIYVNNYIELYEYLNSIKIRISIGEWLIISSLSLLIIVVFLQYSYFDTSFELSIWKSLLYAAYIIDNNIFICHIWAFIIISLIVYFLWYILFIYIDIFIIQNLIIMHIDILKKIYRIIIKFCKFLNISSYYYNLKFIYFWITCSWYFFLYIILILILYKLNIYNIYYLLVQTKLIPYLELNMILIDSILKSIFYTSCICFILYLTYGIIISAFNDVLHLNKILYYILLFFLIYYFFFYKFLKFKIYFILYYIYKINFITSLNIIYIYIFPYILPFISIIGSLLLFIIAIAFFTLLERKLLGSIQRRRGPNITGLLGFIQPIADGIKLLFKEYTYLQYNNIIIYILAPVLSFGTTLLLLLCMPFFKYYSIFEIDLNILFILAFSSFGIHGIIYAGWASNTKYSLLGSIRSGAQLISYELTISIIILTIIIFNESASLDEIGFSQSYIWNLWILFPLWILFLICSLAEGARIPFDLPEAEAELVAGYNLEYSAISFAMFFLGEYGNLIIFSNLSALLFTGISFNIYIYMIKIAIFSSLYIIIRATFPRFRYDQLMVLGWQVLLPVSFIYFVLINIIKLIIISIL